MVYEVTFEGFDINDDRSSDSFLIWVWSNERAFLDAWLKENNKKVTEVRELRHACIEGVDLFLTEFDRRKI
jgi:hypothetical protein